MPEVWQFAHLARWEGSRRKPEHVRMPCVQPVLPVGGGVVIALLAACAVVLPGSNVSVSAAGVVAYRDVGDAIVYADEVPRVVRVLVEERRGRGVRVSCSI